MEEFFNAISNFGFPVVVAGYLLFRFEAKIEKLSEVINTLEGSIEELIKEINRRNKV